ncbi:PRD domain-containing protein [Lactiplantibacillus pentosus]|nr:PRD domain-containing protein [Lactiplantibacillus pentosus]
MSKNSKVVTAEIWRVTKYEGYSVSTLGNVRNDKTGRILKPGTTKLGYQIVTVGGKSRLIHRIVMDTFMPISKAEASTLTDIDHINADRGCNELSNLRRCTHAANLRSSHRLALIRHSCIALDKNGAASQAVDLINVTADVILPKSEVVFMTYHFINAGSDGSKLQETIKITKLISGIIDIVQYQYQMHLDPESFNYNRFIAHLRALMVQRVSRSNGTGSELDQSLLQLMQVKYAHAYATVERIDIFLQSKAGWRLEPDDKVYLTLHIWRVTHRQKSE